MQKYKKQIIANGFTLLELMIIVGIIGIMTSVVLVYLGDKDDDEKLEAASRQVAQHIRELQNNALTGGHVDGSPVCGFVLGDISDGDEGYVQSYYPYEAGCPSPPSAAVQELARYDLPEGVSFSGDLDAFYFKVPHATVYDAASHGGFTRGAIVVTDGSNSSYICISATGQVTENGETICS